MDATPIVGIGAIAEVLALDGLHPGRCHRCGTMIGLDRHQVADLGRRPAAEVLCPTCDGVDVDVLGPRHPAIAKSGRMAIRDLRIDEVPF